MKDLGKDTKERRQINHDEFVEIWDCATQRIPVARLWLELKQVRKLKPGYHTASKADLEIFKKAAKELLGDLLSAEQLAVVLKGVSDANGPDLIFERIEPLLITVGIWTNEQTNCLTCAIMFNWIKGEESPAKDAYYEWLKKRLLEQMKGKKPEPKSPTPK